MKVYTGTGDEGKTSLFSGERIAKNDTRIESYGCVDELNAVVGALAAALPEVAAADAVKTQLGRIQSDLFQVGAWLATTPGSPAADHLVPFTSAYPQWVEEQIDLLDAGLEPLNAFILPGGHPAAAWAHLARTVCRRAERQTLRLDDQDALAFQGARELLVYLNRLSDYFFVLARHCNRLAGEKDVPWHA
jgi:cob(I)alamin adenosyltransferase